MIDVRKIAHVGYCARAPDVSPEFIRIAFAHENPAVTPGGTGLRNLSRGPIVVTNFINRVQSVYTRGKMQRGDLFLAVKLEISLGWRPFAED